MKIRILALAGTGLLVAGIIAPAVRAQPEPSHVRLGAEKPVHSMINIEIRNLQDESLGRIQDLGIDLVNGRIVEVLVVSDRSLDVDSKVVAIPPLALLPDVLNEVYRLDVSTETFKSAPAIDLAKWEEAGHSDRVAATYRLFGEEPYFLEDGAVANSADRRPKVPLGYVERSSRIVDLPVGNFQHQKFGKVSSMSLDIPHGRILSVIVLAPGNFLTKTVIPATALTFNAGRDGLLLDDTKVEYRDEPRYVLTEAAFGQNAYSQEESYQGPHTSLPLEQGTSYRDVDQTVRINRQIRAAKLNGRNVQIGTLNDRVTMRGWVATDDDRRRIGEIAIAAAHVELVDNQITVGKPIGRN